MRSVFAKFGKLLLLGVPLLLGLFGLTIVEGEPLLQSLFMSVCMYLFGYQDVPPNLFVELARWTAPLATASSIFLAIAALRYRLHNFVAYRRGGCTAVYGPAEEKAPILKQLGAKGIDGREEFVKAQRYILTGSEGENLAFYQRHQAALAGSTVYLKCRSLPAQASASANLRLFCPEETAARLFWKAHCLFETSAACSHQMKLVFIGFGKLGQELLVCALQNNLFSPEQRIEYHIFGDGAGFTGTHTELSAISDPVIFHSEPWHSQLPLVEQAQAVIVLEQGDQLSLLQELMLATKREPIHVFAADSFGIRILAEQERLTVFDWQQEAGKLENILGDPLFDMAKRINLRYAAIYSGIAETEENKQAEWEKLDPFTRYSNISSADYHMVQRKLLALSGQSADALPGQWLELLSELEHIRWCRYHYLNNWRYGVPENGKAKDKAARLHTALIPYRELSEAEKEKDRENIRILFSIK